MNSTVFSNIRIITNIALVIISLLILFQIKSLRPSECPKHALLFCIFDGLTTWGLADSGGMVLPRDSQFLVSEPLT